MGKGIPGSEGFARKGEFQYKTTVRENFGEENPT
jgi:hypothetical protein